MFYTDDCLKKEVSIPYPLYQSEKGHYFIGQTPILSGTNSNAAAALFNPPHSNVNLYLNVITVTNISSQNVSAEIYLKSHLKNANVSDSVSCANLSIFPRPIPESKIQYLSAVSEAPKHGVTIFSRIVSPYATEIIDGGQIIIPPGESILVYLGGYLPVNLDNAIVAFGWWEQPICCDC